MISIILGLLPSFAWLTFFLQEDRRQPEPRKLIIYTFLAGAAITFLVLEIQVLFRSISSALGIELFSPIALFLMAGVEEVLKFAAVYFVIKGRKEFDEPVDAMIYMIVAALGFAAVENTASAFQAINGFQNLSVIETTTLRFVGATLLHALSSGLVGYYWAQSIIQKSGYFGSIGAGLFWATLLHTIFNYLIIKFEPLSLATIFLVVLAVVVLVDFEKLKKAVIRE